MMDAEKCRERLSRLMDEERVALKDLSTLLDREHQFLVTNDVVGLEGANRERQKGVARIFRMDEERRSLCRELGYSNDLSGLEKMLRWCDPQGTLSAAWSLCAAAAAQCRQLNDRNGALVGARLKHVQDRLGALINGHREAVTYGPRGAYSSEATGRVVTTEV
jgi:flagella synthesis protein FlgN